MFKSFEASQAAAGSTKRWLISLGLSVIGYVAAIGGWIMLGGAAEPKPQEEPEIEVKFEKLDELVPEPVQPEAPPPPALVSAPKHLRRKPPEPARPPPPMKAEEIPDEKPAEKDASEFAVAAAAPGEGDAAGVEGGSKKGQGTKVASIVPAPPARPAPKPVVLPEDATPPQPVEGNAIPVYPPEMKSAGKEATVILKVIIDHTGRVTAAKVMRGEEPFASAALSAVKTWRYKPAMHMGQPIAVFTIVKIPFKLKFG